MTKRYPDSLTLSSLDGFLAFVEFHGAERAAEETGTTATTIMRRIRRLQDWLGEELVTSGNPPQLTDYANDFINVGWEVFEIYNRLGLHEDRKRVLVLEDGTMLRDGYKVQHPEAQLAGRLLLDERASLRTRRIEICYVTKEEAKVAEMRSRYETIYRVIVKLHSNLGLMRLSGRKESSYIVKKLIKAIAAHEALSRMIDEEYGPFRMVDPKTISFDEDRAAEQSS